MWTYNLISNKYLTVKQLFLKTLQYLSSLLSAHTRAGALFLAGPDSFLGNCYDQFLIGLRPWHLPKLCRVGPSAHLGSSCNIPWSGILVGAAHSWCLLPLPTQSQVSVSWTLRLTRVLPSSKVHAFPLGHLRWHWVTSFMWVRVGGSSGLMIVYRHGRSRVPPGGASEGAVSGPRGQNLR